MQVVVRFAPVSQRATQSMSSAVPVRRRADAITAINATVGAEGLKSSQCGDFSTHERRGMRDHAATMLPNSLYGRAKDEHAMKADAIQIANWLAPSRIK